MSHYGGSELLVSGVVGPFSSGELQNMAVNQTTAHVHKNADADIRGLNVQEEATTEINVGAIAGSLTTAVENLAQVKRTIITFAARSLAVTDALAYAGTKVYDFPAKRIRIIGASSSLQFAVKTTMASTINASAEMDYSFGTVTASSITLASTMVDVIPKVDSPLAATIDTLSTAAVGALAAGADFAASSDVYLNVAFPTNTEIDADGTLEVTGTLTLTWVELD